MKLQLLLLISLRELGLYDFKSSSADSAELRLFRSFAVDNIRTCYARILPVIIYNEAVIDSDTSLF